EIVGDGVGFGDGIRSRVHAVAARVDERPIGSGVNGVAGVGTRARVRSATAAGGQCQKGPGSQRKAKELGHDGAPRVRDERRDATARRASQAADQTYPAACLDENWARALSEF